MEPLRALGLVANVMQFADFATRLFSDAKDIHRAGRVAPEDNLQLEYICETLSKFTLELTPDNTPPDRFERHALPKKDATSLNNLVSSCREDCENLISLLKVLSIDKTKNRPWGGIKVLVRNAQHKERIKAVESRILKAQSMMTLHIQSVIGLEIKKLSENIALLRHGNTRLQLGQDSSLEEIDQCIRNLKLHEKDKSFESMGINHIRTQISTHLALQDEVSRVQSVLSTLQFDSRSARHSSIVDAHNATFKWIYNSKLSAWLKSGEGIFWISGKAGSGKSTLMKFIANNKTVMKIAEASSQAAFVIASHYFWSPGTDMQQSQQGLLQSLLFDVLRQCPKLIPLLCPQRWEAESHSLEPNLFWTIEELSSCLNAISDHIDNSVKFLFFIDGLDEFTGDHIHLCQILQSLSKSPNIKLCVSSRPWNVFEDFFGKDDDQRLCIHELTRDDIGEFARDRLQGHPRWKTCAVDIEHQPDLIDEITERAEGVFLWAFLVTKSLRDGISNDDTISDLKRRLRSLPTDLEQLFKNLLSGVDSVYHEKMAAYLKIALWAKGPLSLSLYHHHSKQFESEEYAYMRLKRPSPMEHSRDLQQTRRRINAQTCGLLETVSINNSEQGVQFLHRTVRDFLKTKEMDQFIAEKARSNFDPALEICKASLASIKYDDHIRVRGPQDRLDYERTFHILLVYSTEVAPENTDTLVNVLDNLERSIVDMSSEKHDQSRAAETAFRRHILWYNVSRYVSAKLTQSSGHFDNFDTDPLHIACNLPFGMKPFFSLVAGEHCLPVDAIQVLLEHGQNPNRLFNFHPSSTPWRELMRVHFSDSANAAFLVNGSLIQTFLRQGADANGNMTRGDSEETQLSAFAIFLFACFDLNFCQRISTQKYMNILHEFLTHRADFQLRLRGSTGQLCFGRTITRELAPDTISKVFINSLGLKSKDWIKPDPDHRQQCRFLYCITEKLISLGKFSGSEICLLSESMPKLFPKEYHKELLSVISRQAASSSDGKRKTRDFSIRRGHKRHRRSG